MKKKLISLLLCLIGGLLIAQTKSLPTYNVKDVEGKDVDISSITKGKRTVMFFWASWSSPSKRELEYLNDYLPEWGKKYNVQIIAVCLDDKKSQDKAIEYIKSKQLDWKYTYMFDITMNLPKTIKENTGCPFTVFLNEKNEILYEHIGFDSTNDDVVFDEKLKELFK